MSKGKLIGNLSFEVYSDGTINVEGKGLSLENASYSLGKIINDMVSKEDTGSYGRIEQCHKCIRAFADGLRADYIAAGWRETAEEVPFPEYNGVEFPNEKKFCSRHRKERLSREFTTRKKRRFGTLRGREIPHRQCTVLDADAGSPAWPEVARRD